MTGDRDDLLEEALAIHRDVARLVLAHAAPTWLELDLTMPQMKTFVVVAKEGPVTIGHVSEHLGVGPATASHLVDRLVRSGLVERREDALDRRRALVMVSPQGAELAERLRGERDRMREWLSRMDEEDVAALTRGMRALRDVLQREANASRDSRLPCEMAGSSYAHKVSSRTGEETRD